MAAIPRSYGDAPSVVRMPVPVPESLQPGGHALSLAHPCSISAHVPEDAQAPLGASDAHENLGLLEAEF